MSNEFIQERLLRKAHALSACDWANPFLSDVMTGIRPTELAVIGARTGAGKTELATMMALANARAGKRVFLFALEAERFEILRRIKFTILAREFFENRADYPSHISLNFNDWLHDKYPELEELENFVDRKGPIEMDNLTIYTPGISDFSKRDFSTVYEEVAGDANLIILDHIHYISPGDRENEYDHIKKTMWSLRDLINKHEVPIIAMSHLRKESRQNFSLVPTLDEIHGSSEIVKQANHVIGVAPISKIPKKHNPLEFNPAPDGATLFRVLKTRTGQTCGRYTAMVRFDIGKKTYDEKYVPFRTDQFCTQLSHIAVGDFERWMTKAREAHL